MCKCNLNLLLEFFKVIKYIDMGQKKKKITGQCLDTLTVFSFTWMQLRFISGISKCLSKGQLWSIAVITINYRKHFSREVSVNKSVSSGNIKTFKSIEVTGENSEENSRHLKFQSCQPPHYRNLVINVATFTF